MRLGLRRALRQCQTTVWCISLAFVYRPPSPPSQLSLVDKKLAGMCAGPHSKPLPCKGSNAHAKQLCGLHQTPSTLLQTIGVRVPLHPATLRRFFASRNMHMGLGPSARRLAALLTTLRGSSAARADQQAAAPDAVQQRDQQRHRRGQPKAAAGRPPSSTPLPTLQHSPRTRHGWTSPGEDAGALCVDFIGKHAWHSLQTPALPHAQVVYQHSLRGAGRSRRRPVLSAAGGPHPGSFSGVQSVGGGARGDGR